MKTTRLLSLILTAALLASCLSANAFAATTTKYRFGQTEARSMLSLINTFRKPGNAWYWDETDTRKIEPTDLKDLTYDYALEAAAMQRAAEIAVLYSHMRPDGTTYFTAYEEYAASGTFRTMGENIAMGNTADMQSAQGVFEAWCETNEKYAGQGHRRNMLYKNFTGIGIGHVICNGIHYWVQEFGAPLSGAAYTDPLDGEKDVTIRSSSDPRVTFVEAFSAGDIDGNRLIEAADARLALRASVQLEQYSSGSLQFLAADVDKNGKIEASDARSILRAAVGLQKLNDSKSPLGTVTLDILPDAITLSKGGVAFVPVKVTWAGDYDTLVNERTSDAIGMLWAGEMRASDGSNLIYMCVTGLADSGSGAVNVKVEGLPQVSDTLTVNITETLPEGVVGDEWVPDLGAHWRVSPEKAAVDNGNRQFTLIYRTSDIVAQTGFTNNKEVLEDCLPLIEEKGFVYTRVDRKDNPNGEGYADFIYFYNEERDCEIILGIYYINDMVYKYFFSWTI